MQEIINNIIWIFNANPIAQSVGLVALLIQIIAVLNKDDRKLIIFQTIAVVFWMIHYWLMWLFIASVIALLNIMRWIAVLKFPKNVKLFLIFFILYWINAIYNYQNIISILAIIASLSALYTFFFLLWKWIIFRICLFWVWVLWLSYHFLNQSIWWTINELLMTSLNLVTIFRLYKDKIKLEKLELEPEYVKIKK